MYFKSVTRLAKSYNCVFAFAIKRTEAPIKKHCKTCQCTVYVFVK